MPGLGMVAAIDLGWNTSVAGMIGKLMVDYQILLPIYIDAVSELGGSRPEVGNHLHVVTH